MTSVIRSTSISKCACL